MMRSLYLAAALLFATPALAQQPDPADAFAAEWQTVVASDTLAAASHKHTAELAQRLVQAYQAQTAELKKLRDDNAALDSSKAWVLDNWVPKPSE